MKVAIPRGKYVSWLGNSPGLLLLIGVTAALIIVALVIMWLMKPPFKELASLVGTLAVSSILTLAVGYILYRRGWARSPSLGLTLIMANIWGAGVTLFNVWLMARLMFVNKHDLTLAGVLLLFAALIATTFGIFVAASVTDGLRQVAKAADHLSEGDLRARTPVTGRDEIAQVAIAFNEMANHLEESAKEREELENLRRDLIAWTSHDLRTPLTSIRVMIEALHDGVVTDEETRQRYYKTIRADIVALNALITDLFDLAQLEAGGLPLELENHSLRDLISDTLETFRPLAETRTISLEGQVGDDLDPVWMNAAKIGRVLSNLINNALQYTPVGGMVHVQATRNGKGVEVIVQDSGQGFTENDISRIFEKFYRGEQARSRATGGAGLGLAIAKGIVEAHGGQMWAENGADRGAIVGFTLPGRT
ncbi:MAG: ATP-binding protein [Candidatus Promineifilaceae bacterium]